jgi:hypothetical protein
MNLFYRLLVGPNGPNYSPSSSTPLGGNSILAGVLANNQPTPPAQPSITPSPTPAADPAPAAAVPTPLSLAAVPVLPLAAPPPVSSGWIDVPIVTQAFGAISTGKGISVKDGLIQVDTEELEGPVNGGSY